jgi:hypothetical protein
LSVDDAATSCGLASRLVGAGCRAEALGAKAGRVQLDVASRKSGAMLVCHDRRERTNVRQRTHGALVGSAEIEGKGTHDLECSNR